MIFVYVDSLRMAYVQNNLNAATLLDVESVQENDTIIFPVLNKTNRKIPLKKGFLNLSSLENVNLFLPFSYPFFKENNNVFYYMQDEELVKANAKLTAGGLLALLGTLPIVLQEAVFDVVGFGKCGQAITSLLQSMQLKVRVIRRESEDESQISLSQYATMKKGNIVINTAPDNVFENMSLKDENIDYVIDISSKRCIKKEMLAQTCELIYPGSLPNKYFPYSAAKLISDYVKGKGYEK